MFFSSHEFKIISHPPLQVRESLTDLDREIALLKTFSQFWKDLELIDYEPSHGGYVGISLRNYFDTVQVVMWNTGGEDGYALIRNWDEYRHINERIHTIAGRDYLLRINPGKTLEYELHNSLIRYALILSDSGNPYSEIHTVFSWFNRFIQVRDDYLPIFEKEMSVWLSHRVCSFDNLYEIVSTREEFLDTRVSSSVYRILRKPGEEFVGNLVKFLTFIRGDPMVWSVIVPIKNDKDDKVGVWRIRRNNVSTSNPYINYFGIEPAIFHIKGSQITIQDRIDHSYIFPLDSQNILAISNEYQKLGDLESACYYISMYIGVIAPTRKKSIEYLVALRKLIQLYSQLGNREICNALIEDIN